MVLVNYSGKEINAKVVYYGPGLCGKTTNLEYIYGRVPHDNRGKMVSMKTRTERTLFFDFLPLSLGDLAGFQTRFLLYTVPGQVYYNATRKLVLKGVDAVIFVADSGRGKMDENLESFENLCANLREHGLDASELPVVLQYNKRDLPETYTVEEMEKALNPDGRLLYFEASAMNGQGVFETFKGVARLLLAHLSKSMGLTQKAGERTPIPGEMPATQPEPPRAPAADATPHEPPARVGPPRPELRSAPESASPPPSTGELPALTKGPAARDAGLSIVKGQSSTNQPSTPTSATPGASAPDDSRTLRVPVFVSQADIEAGVTIELVLRVDRSASDEDEVRSHFG